VLKWDSISQSFKFCSCQCLFACFFYASLRYDPVVLSLFPLPDVFSCLSYLALCQVLVCCCWWLPVSVLAWRPWLCRNREGRYSIQGQHWMPLKFHNGVLSDRLWVSICRVRVARSVVILPHVMSWRRSRCLIKHHGMKTAPCILNFGSCRRWLAIFALWPRYLQEGTSRHTLDRRLGGPHSWSGPGWREEIPSLAVNRNAVIQHGV
jgi:hypothetical protein